MLFINQNGFNHSKLRLSQNIISSEEYIAINCL